MNGFMMYMSGAGIHIFSIMITFMGIMNPAKAILGVHGGELNDLQIRGTDGAGRSGHFLLHVFCVQHRGRRKRKMLPLQDEVVRFKVTQRFNGADVRLKLPRFLTEDQPSAFSFVFHRCVFAKAEY